MQQLEVGAILEGKVVKIASFGAFVELPDKRNGMVHISEISQSYVNDIAEYLKVDQTVKVKVINIAEDGKISLSIKRAMENPEPRRQGGPRPFAGNRPSGDRRGAGEGRTFGANRPAGNRPAGNRPGGRPAAAAGAKQPAAPISPFEEMLQQFKKSSDDRMSDLKRFDVKRGAANRKSRSR